VCEIARASNSGIFASKTMASYAQSVSPALYSRSMADAESDAKSQRTPREDKYEPMIREARDDNPTQSNYVCGSKTAESDADSSEAAISRGSMNQNVEPFPFALSAPIAPPINSTSPLQMDNPSPVPP